MPSQESIESKLTDEIHNFCERIAGSSTITASCICGDYAIGLSNSKATLEVLLIVRNFQPRLMNYVKLFENHYSIFYAVDEWVFERDIAGGFLGEALAGKMILPYWPLFNEEFLRTHEIRLKKRLVLELLENLVLDFPELSFEFRIKPEYFLYETLLSRAKLFPLAINRVLDFACGENKEENLQKAMDAYRKALVDLEERNMLVSAKGYYRISDEFMKRFSKRRITLLNIIRTAHKAQRSLFQSSLGVFPELLANLSRNREGLFKLRLLRTEMNQSQQIEDPQNYILLPTSHGLVPLADRTDIQGIARRVLSLSKDSPIIVKRIGGVLNDVYEVQSPNEKLNKAIVKRYKDWSSFKWFPLSLWTVGTRTFSVLGISRLEREVGISEFLSRNKFDVPKILHVSPNQRLVFMEYIEGEDMSHVINRIGNSKDYGRIRKDLICINRLGKKIAKVHSLDVSLGDAKPENFIIGRHGELYMTDFEQAARKGDKTWDIAEFLFYAGHDLPPLVDTRKAEMIAESFISGYIAAGGEAAAIRKTARPKYTKVFSVFTLPNIMLAIINVCNRTT